MISALLQLIGAILGLFFGFFLLIGEGILRLAFWCLKGIWNGFLKLLEWLFKDLIPSSIKEFWNGFLKLLKWIFKDLLPSSIKWIFQLIYKISKFLFLKICSLINIFLFFCYGIVMQYFFKFNLTALILWSIIIIGGIIPLAKKKFDFDELNPIFFIPAIIGIVILGSFSTFFLPASLALHYNYSTNTKILSIVFLLFGLVKLFISYCNDFKNTYDKSFLSYIVASEMIGILFAPTPFLYILRFCLNAIGLLDYFFSLQKLDKSNNYIYLILIGIMSYLIIIKSYLIIPILLIVYLSKVFDRFINGDSSYNLNRKYFMLHALISLIELHLSSIFIVQQTIFYISFAEKAIILITLAICIKTPKLKLKLRHVNVPLLEGMQNCSKISADGFIAAHRAECLKVKSNVYDIEREIILIESENKLYYTYAHGKVFNNYKAYFEVIDDIKEVYRLSKSELIVITSSGRKISFTGNGINKLSIYDRASLNNNYSSTDKYVIKTVLSDNL